MSKLRYFNMIPYEEDYIIIDPLGISPPLHVSKEVALIIYLIAAYDDKEKVIQEFSKYTGLNIDENAIDEVLKKLDEHYLLKNERFESRLNEVEEELSKKEYKEFDTIAPQSFSDIIKSMQNIDHHTNNRTFALITPHMDFRVAMETYRKAFAYLKGTNRDIVLILGVPHGWAVKPFPIMDKPYKLVNLIFHTHKQAIEDIKSKFEEDITTDYLAFKNEHSVEFPIVFSYITKQGNVKFIPTIVSSYERTKIKEMARALYEALKEYEDRLFIISSIDLSHVGPKFGDDEPYDTTERDEEYLKLLSQMKNDDAYELLEEDNNRTRIDGKYTNYMLLELLKLFGVSSGRIIDYQVYHEKETNSKVSYGSVVFEK